MMMKPRRVARFLVIGLLIFSTLACTLFTPRQADEEDRLRVLASSELKDLEPLLPDIRRATGVEMMLEYTGTLEGAEQIAAGSPADFAWFSHAKYIELLKGAPGRVHAQEKIMLSPVVLGVKASKAADWGWADNANLTWKDIAAKAASEELNLAMSNPATSNSGFSALAGVAASLAGKTDGLQTRDISAVSDTLKAFLSGQALTARGSGWLAEEYVENEERLDGMINYESVLLRLNKSGALREPLTLLYPKEGTITADYPLLLINPGKRAAYQSVVAYLRSPAFQKKLMNKTLRRPVNPQVELSSDFPTQLRVELPFPGSLAVANELLSAGLDPQARPTHTYYVVDTSQAMKGARLDSLKQALYALTGADSGLASRFARFPNRETITMIAFNNRVADRQDFAVDFNEPASLEPVQAYIDGLRAGGRPALYAALAKAYQQAVRDKIDEPERSYAIVLLSYGQSSTGISAKRFLSGYRKLDDRRGIRMFTLFFGEADVETVQDITNMTGGRLYFAGQDSLPVLFNEIRGYE